MHILLRSMLLLNVFDHSIENWLCNNFHWIIVSIYLFLFEWWIWMQNLDWDTILVTSCPGKPINVSLIYIIKDLIWIYILNPNNLCRSKLHSVVQFYQYGTSILNQQASRQYIYINILLYHHWSASWFV